MVRPRNAWPSRVLVTGGAGFIGSNVVRRLHASGVEVIALDNLSRAASSRNAAALRRDCPDGLRLVEGDVRDASAVRQATG